MGLNDRGNEGTFTCPGGSQAPNNTADFFATDEPSNGGNGEHCALFSGSHRNFLLNDLPCSSTFKFLCERDPGVEGDL